MSCTEMRVNMDCSGCEKNIRKALKKVKGVDSVDIDMALQKVTVMGWARQEEILKAIRKAGKNAEMWPYPYNPESYNYYQQPNSYYQNSNNYYPNNYYQESNHYYPDYNFYRQPVTIQTQQPVTIQTQQPVTYYYKPGKSKTKSKTDSYKYKKQYNNYHYKEDHYGYFQKPLYSTLLDVQACSIFSDENPHACSIM